MLDQQLWPWGCLGPARWESHTLTRSGCRQRSWHWRGPQSKNSPWSSRVLFAVHLPKKKETGAQECSFNPSKQLLAALPADAPSLKELQLLYIYSMASHKKSNPQYTKRGWGELFLFKYKHLIATTVVWKTHICFELSSIFFSLSLWFFFFFMVSSEAAPLNGGAPGKGWNTDGSRLLGEGSSEGTHILNLMFC